MPYVHMTSGSSRYSSEIAHSSAIGRIHYSVAGGSYDYENGEVTVRLRPSVRLQLKSKTKGRNHYYWRVGVEDGQFKYCVVPKSLFVGVDSAYVSSSGTTWHTAAASYTFDSGVFVISFPLDYDNTTSKDIIIPPLRAYYNSSTNLTPTDFPNFTFAITFSAAQINVHPNKNTPEGLSDSDITIGSTTHYDKDSTIESITDAVDKTDTYDFVGWHINSPTGPLMTFPYTLTSTDDIELFAAWKKSTKSELSVKENDAWQKGDANARASNGEWVTADRVYVRKKDIWL